MRRGYLAGKTLVSLNKSGIRRPDTRNMLSRQVSSEFVATDVELDFTQAGNALRVGHHALPFQFI